MMKNGSIYNFLLVAAVVLSLTLAGCRKPKPVDPPVPATHVFLMYDNIGGIDFSENVAAAGKAVAEGALGKGERVVVYHRSYRLPETTERRSVIYELVKDASEPKGFSRKVLKQYAEGENASLSKETIAGVVGDVRRLVPAPNYGLAFGSHGMGWIPKVNPAGLRRSAVPDPFADLWTIPENPLTRYLAYNTKEKIDVGEFADALDEWSWDFVIFDDCFMASVEALYEIRHLADYFIASPTEILIAGFPYDRVVSTLFADWTDLAGVAKGFVDYYRDGYGTGPNATVAVVESSELEALAQSVRNIRLDGYNDVDPTAAPEVQSYEGLLKHVFYDLDDYMDRWAKSSSLYEVFYDRLQKAVVFADHTDYFYTAKGLAGPKPIKHYSGLNVFIPWSGWSSLIPDYRQTEWYKYVYGE